MATENFFGGFESIAGSLSNRTTVTGGNTGDDPEDKNIPFVDPNELEEEEEPVEPQEDDNKGEEPKVEPPEIEEEEEEEEEKEGESKEEEGEKGEGESDLSEVEPEISQFLQEKLADTLGWEFNEDEKFNSVEDVVDFLKSVVEVNSKPTYANEEIEKLNSFVENGGAIEDYIKVSRGESNLDTIDMSKESNQKSVIKELLSEKGYSEARINRSIERYEDAGVLEDEANDAKEMLSEIRQEKAEKLLKAKEKEQEAIKEEQQKYISSVEESVKTLDSVRGIPISETEKKQLVNYIFKPTADGRTAYQKDYLSDVKNLIESAYFTMKGDAFVQKVKRKANSEAAKNLKTKLATSKNKRKSSNTDNDGEGIWDLISSQLRKPN